MSSAAMEVVGTQAAAAAPRSRSGGGHPRSRSGAAGAPRRRVVVWIGRVVIAAVLLGIWQWYGSTEGGVFVPSLTATVRTFPELVTSGHLGAALGASNVSVLVGYPIAAICGTAIGFLIGRRRTADKAVSYWLDVTMVIPMVAIVPVVIVALGLTLTARVAVVVLFALPVIAMNSRAAVRVIDSSLVEMGQAFAATPRQLWTAVILPAAVPQLFAGLRIGIGRAISGMIVVELLLVPAGLGELLLNYKAAFSTPELYAVTMVVIAEGVILTSLGHAWEHRIDARMSGSRA